MSSIRPTFTGFETAKSAVFTSQKSLDIVGNNLANVNTEGYTRQRVHGTGAYHHGVALPRSAGRRRGQVGIVMHPGRMACQRFQRKIRLGLQHRGGGFRWYEVRLHSCRMVQNLGQPQGIWHSAGAADAKNDAFDGHDVISL